MSLKSLTIIATTIFAASFAFAVSSQAGCGGGHRGFSKSYSHSASYKAKKRAKARARARARLAAKKRAKAKAFRIAKAKAKAKAQRLAAAKTESTFVSVQSTAALLTDGDVQKNSKDEKPNLKIADAEVDTTENTVVAAADDTGCTRFIPAVGRTISVDCQ